jgi:DTW domain-containing protein YfiP
MGGRKKRTPRCSGCGLPPEGCVCDRLPSLAFATRIAFVQHVDEIHKPTNTARVFARMVEGTPIVPYGMREPAFDPSALQGDDTEWCVLFPREGAPDLDATLPPPPPGIRRGFVVLDGTWHQCSRMGRRAPFVRELPCVALPAGEPTFWTVRTQHDPRGMSSFDAAYRSLRAIEGADAVRPLLEAFALVTARMLHLKGRLASPDVPAEWLAPVERLT